MEHHVATESFSSRPPANGAISFAPAQIVERYRSHVDHFDLSEQQKAELLLTLWQIMRSFVDRAFGEDSVQLSQKDGDDFLEIDEFERSPVVNSQDNPPREKERNLSGTFGQKARRIPKEKR